MNIHDKFELLTPSDAQKQQMLSNISANAVRPGPRIKYALLAAALPCTLLAACGVKMWTDRAAYEQKVRDRFEDDLYFSQAYEGYVFDYRNIHVEIIGSTAGENVLNIYYTTTEKHNPLYRPSAGITLHPDIRAYFPYEDYKFLYAYDDYKILERDEKTNTTLHQYTVFYPKAIRDDFLFVETRYHEYYGDAPYDNYGIVLAHALKIDIVKDLHMICEDVIKHDMFTGDVYLDNTTLQIRADFTRPNSDNVPAHNSLEMADALEAYRQSLQIKLIKKDGSKVTLKDERWSYFGDQHGYEKIFYLQFDKVIAIEDYAGVVIAGQEIYFE